MRTSGNSSSPTISAPGEKGRDDHNSAKSFSKSWLFRLLKSDLMDPMMVLSYLWKFRDDNHGIHFLLVKKMKTFPSMELLPILPQLCHLLICTENLSTCLKNFLIEECQKHLHVAIFTLFFLENYLADYRKILPKNQPAYDRISALLTAFQSSIFRTSIIEGSQKSPKLPNISANLMGMSLGVAGIVASPQWTNQMKEMVYIEATNGISTLGHKELAAFGQKVPEPFVQVNRLQDLEPNSVTLEELHTGKAFTIKEYFVNAAKQIQTSPTTQNAIKRMSRSTASISPLSATSLSISSNSNLGLSQAKAPTLYYTAEMQFIASLVDISQRLLALPKGERAGGLETELSVINHNLPASLCLPLWCDHVDADSLVTSDEEDRCSSHHKILRILAKEAILLNSAERAPFLVLIETLSDASMNAEEFSKLSQLSHSLSQSSLLDRSGSERIARSKSPNLLPPPLESDLKAPHHEAPIPLIDTIPELPLSLDSPPVSGGLEMAPLSNDDFAIRMRTAAIMLAQLTRQSAAPGISPEKSADISAIREKIIKEMELLERNRIFDAFQCQSPEAEDKNRASNDDEGLFKVDEKQDFSSQSQKSHNTEKSKEECLQEMALENSQNGNDDADLSAEMFQEPFELKKERIRTNSPFGHLQGWNLISLIVKSNSDVRQEQLACQIIQIMSGIWKRANIPLWTFCYKILLASANGGMIETVTDSISLHSLKKTFYAKAPEGSIFSLRNHFIKSFGSPDGKTFKEAINSFISSLAAYSLVTFFLQVKDRHDGNILIDRKGHLIHIDYGFMLSNSPGYVGFESAPFKLSGDFIEVLGGLHSRDFQKFKNLFFQGFLELRKHSDRIITPLEVMSTKSSLPCFYSSSAIDQLKRRFNHSLTEEQLRQIVDRLVIGSAFNVFTRLYDSFQYYSNGIL